MFQGTGPGPNTHRQPCAKSPTGPASCTQPMAEKSGGIAKGKTRRRASPPFQGRSVRMTRKAAPVPITTAMAVASTETQSEFHTATRLRGCRNTVA